MRDSKAKKPDKILKNSMMLTIRNLMGIYSVWKKHVYKFRMDKNMDFGIRQI